MFLSLCNKFGQKQACTRKFTFLSSNVRVATQPLKNWYRKIKIFIRLIEEQTAVCWHSLLMIFRVLKIWQVSIKEFSIYADIQDGNNFPFVIKGNKIDMENRMVSTEMAQEWCQANGQAPYFETSAKDSTNVDEAFKAAIKRLRDLEDVIEIKTQHGNTVDLKRKAKTQSSGCCGNWWSLWYFFCKIFLIFIVFGKYGKSFFLYSSALFL